MDVTIVNPICARLAQPGHDAQVSIETSTLLLWIVASQMCRMGGQ